MSAAAAMAAAAEQKDMGWMKVGKVAKKPKLVRWLARARRRCPSGALFPRRRCWRVAAPRRACAGGHAYRDTPHARVDTRPSAPRYRSCSSIHPCCAPAVPRTARKALPTASVGMSCNTRPHRALQGDPLQLFSLCEVIKSDGTGPEAKLTVKVIDAYWDKPMNFLPQGGGPSDGEELEVLRKDLLPANPASQDQTADLADLDKCAAAALAPRPLTNAVGCRLTSPCCLTSAA
jgi:hypothetical protein